MVIQTALVEVFPLSSGELWVRIGVLVLLGLALLTLYRQLRGERVPKPHPLQARVNDLLCDLSEDKGEGAALAERIIALRDDFMGQGIFDPHFPAVAQDASRPSLNAAARRLKEMANLLY